MRVGEEREGHQRLLDRARDGAEAQLDELPGRAEVRAGYCDVMPTGGEEPLRELHARRWAAAPDVGDGLPHRHRAPFARGDHRRGDERAVAEDVRAEARAQVFIRAQAEGARDPDGLRDLHREGQQPVGGYAHTRIVRQRPMQLREIRSEGTVGGAQPERLARFQPADAAAGPRAEEGLKVRVDLKRRVGHHGGDDGDVIEPALGAPDHRQHHLAVALAEVLRADSADKLHPLACLAAGDGGLGVPRLAVAGGDVKLDRAVGTGVDPG